MTNFKEVLQELTENLNILREREARYAGNAPVELINQISDHQQAIALTRQLITNQLSQAEWDEALRPLLVNIRRRSQDDKNCRVKTSHIQQVIIGDVSGGIKESQFAGRDINITNIYSSPSDMPAPKKSARRLPPRSHRSAKLPVWAIIIGVVGMIGLLAAGGVLLMLGGTQFGLLGGQASSDPPATTLPDVPMPMPGSSLKIAFTGFTQLGSVMEFGPGRELAQNVALDLQKRFDTQEQGFALVWGPELLKQNGHPGFLSGQKPDDLKDAASDLVKKAQADLVIYGFVDDEQNVVPLFEADSVTLKDLYDFSELIGEQGLSRSLSLASEDGSTEMRETQRQLSSRVELLVYIINGLNLIYSKEPKYNDGFVSLQKADVDSWPAKQGRYLLYILLGNAAGKLGDFYSKDANKEQARVHYQKANDYYHKASDILIASNHNYPGVFLGLGDSYYHLATVDPNQVDKGFLQDSIKSYEKARAEAKDDPTPYLAVNAKYGLAESLWIRGYLNKSERDIDQAVELFNDVIADYGKDARPLLKERAGEAYARLGNIYYYRGDNNCALLNYNTALGLISDTNPNLDQYNSDIARLKELEAQADCPDNK